MQTTIITPPAVEPVTLQQAKNHLRVLDSDNDDLIESYIQSAREYVENFTSRSLVTQTLELTMAAFQNEVYLTGGPVQSIVSVKYLDTAGVEQTLSSSNYVLTKSGKGASYLHRAESASFPASKTSPNAVSIRYVAGYSPTTDSPTNYTANVPETIKTCIMQLVQADFDDLRAEDRAALQSVIDRKLWPFRLMSF